MLLHRQLGWHVQHLHSSAVSLLCTHGPIPAWLPLLHGGVCLIACRRRPGTSCLPTMQSTEGEQAVRLPDPTKLRLSLSSERVSPQQG